MGGAPRGAVDPRLQRQRRLVGGRGRGRARRYGAWTAAARLANVEGAAGPRWRLGRGAGRRGGRLRRTGSAAAAWADVGGGWRQRGGAGGRGDVEGAAGVRWRSGAQGRGAGRPATADGVGGSGVVVGGEGTRARESGEKRQRTGAGRPLTYPPLCRPPTVGKDSLPSAGEQQRGGAGGL